MRVPLFLPATMCQYTHPRLYLEEALFVRAERAQPEAARPGIARERLCMTIDEERVRFEGFLLKLERDGSEVGQRPSTSLKLSSFLI